MDDDRSACDCHILGTIDPRSQSRLALFENLKSWQSWIGFKGVPFDDMSYMSHSRLISKQVLNMEIAMNRLKLSALALGAAAFVAAMSSPAAYAADNAITTSISGYGTVAATVTGDSSTQYRSDQLQFKGASKQPDIGGDSRLGLQGVVNLTPQFSVTAQALIRRRGDKDFDIGTEWMFAQYTPTPGLDLRLGRVGMTTFLFSDSRNVGYAAPWLRAPNEVYAIMPLTSLDGGQANWRATVGPVSLTSQLSFGKSSATILAGAAGTLPIDARSLVSLALTGEVGNWTMRIANSTLKAPQSIPLSPQFTLNYTNRDKFVSAGLMYDDAKTIVIGEWTKRTQPPMPILNTPFVCVGSWYLAAGYRIGSLTPMVRYSHLAYSRSLLAGPSQNSEALILRYDAFRNVAFKAQLDRFDASNTSAFVVPHKVPGDKVHVLSIGADFLF